MTNPLLETHTLPPFSRISPEHVKTAIGQIIERNKQRIAQLLANNSRYTWDNLLQPIEDMADELAQAWSPVSHLNSVCNSDELRDAYNACLPLLSEYSTWMGQHTALCTAHQQIADDDAFSTLDTAQRKTIENALRDFRLAGVALPDEQKQEYGELRKRLSELGSKFGENVLDATNAWSRQASREELNGLPETALASARQAAQQAGMDDYLINLEFPSYSPVLSYCHNRELREEVYTANCTRASDRSPLGDQWDNAAIIREILDLRAQLASLLGFDSYAQLSLATKMADSPTKVTDFLQQLAAKSHSQAVSEWQELADFAVSEDGISSLEAWDVSYYSEKLRQQRYQLSQEDIRPYLPVTRALDGLFEVVQRLYGLEINRDRGV